jgi:beta-glucuronidase
MDIEGGFDRQTVGWYVREFEWDNDSPFVRLRFDGVFREARVWLNGQELGGDDLPYLPFAFDVTGRLYRDSPNLLVVRVDNRIGRQTLPCDTTTAPGLHGWFPYGGISRPVVVEGSRATSVARLSVRTFPGDGPWRVTADVVLQRAVGASGASAAVGASEGSAAVGASGTTRLSASIKKGDATVLNWGPADLPADVSRLAIDGLVQTPQMWDPEHPDQTYRMNVTIEQDGVVETVSVDFAFRTVEATAGRLLLNGVDRFLHGINRHEDLPDKGPVFDADVMAADVAAMKDLGVDFARTAHYPNDVRTLRALEAAGILLAEEIPVYQFDNEQLADPVLLDKASRALRRMIHRDINRPAIGLWSIANEVWTFADTAPAFLRALRSVAREVDPDRPVMAAMLSAPALSYSEVDLGPAEVDVIGINEYYGWYFNQTSELGDLLDAAHARFPDKTLIVSEYGCDALRARHGYGAPGEEPVDDHSYSEEYQAWFHRQHMRQMSDRDFIRGVAPWVLADFRMQWSPATGKPHPVLKTNLKGLMDAWRHPKAAYDVVKAAYADPGGLSVPAEPACGNNAVEPPEACDGGTMQCADLGTSFASGEAFCRPDCTGWDVMLCTVATPTDLAWEVVKPALRDPVRWGDARCNDGTPFAFRVRLAPIGSQDWVISLDGGGFCDDYALPCIRPLEKTTGLPDEDGAWLVPDDDNGGIFDVDQADNTVWHNTNWVFGPYCSSDFWIGTRTARIPAIGDPDLGWYFAGRLNVQALLETLVRNYGLGDREGEGGPRVLFSGTSSGGLGTLATADLAAAMLPLAAADGRLKVMVDAGWLVHDWDDVDARLAMAQVSDLEVVRVAYDHFQAHMNPLCESARVRAGQHAGDCLMGLYAFPYLVGAPPGGLGLPVLFQQSLVDTAFSGFHNHDDDVEFETLYGLRQESDALAADPGDPLQASWFLGRSRYHDISRKSDWTIGDPGNTFRDLLERFWAGEPSERIIWSP